MKRILELDGLRAVAILFVLGCHYEGFSRLLWRLPQFGWIGVDLFFCLSGYLITSILLGLRGRTTPYTTFYSRRLIRILPPYLGVVALIATYMVHIGTFRMSWLAIQLLFLQAFHPAQDHVLDTLTHMRWYFLHLPPLLANARALPREQIGAPLTILIVPYILWSLSIEEYFYFLWAPIVLNLSKTAIVAVGILICSIEVFLRWSSSRPDVYFDASYRFDALLYGALLAVLLSHRRAKATSTWSQSLLKFVLLVSAAGISMILLLIRPVLGRDPRSSPLALAFGLPLVSIGFAALIGLLILRADSAWWLSRLLRVRPLQFIGTISYTMYLTHLFAAAIIRSLSNVRNVYQQSFFQAFLSSILTIVIAQFSWIFYEKRLLRWKDKRFPNIPHPTKPTAV